MYSWVGALFSAIGLCYFAVPIYLQISFRRVFPPELREVMLKEATKEDWTLYVFWLTIGCAVWASLTPYTASTILKYRLKRLEAKHSSLEIDHQELKDKFAERSIDCYEIFSNYIYAIYGNLNLTPSERISIYRVELGCFRLYWIDYSLK